MVYSAPLTGSQVPYSCCCLLCAWESRVSLCPRCVVRLRAWKLGLTAKVQASIHFQIQKAKKDSFSRKPLSVKKPVLWQAPAREVQMSFGVHRAKLPWENIFSVIPTSSTFFFQCLFTVNYCFRLTHFSSLFSPGNCCKALQG